MLAGEKTQLFAPSWLVQSVRALVTTSTLGAVGVMAPEMARREQAGIGWWGIGEFGWRWACPCCVRMGSISRIRWCGDHRRRDQQGYGLGDQRGVIKCHVSRNEVISSLDTGQFSTRMKR